MNELYNLSIQELIESIEENILETKELRKRLLIELNQEKDVNRKIIKKEIIERYDENMFRFKMQMFGIEEAIKEHAVYGYKKISIKSNEKTAQEVSFQEQPIIIKRDIISKICTDNYFSLSK